MNKTFYLSEITHSVKWDFIVIMVNIGIFSLCFFMKRMNCIANETWILCICKARIRKFKKEKQKWQIRNAHNDMQQCFSFLLLPLCSPHSSLLSKYTVCEMHAYMHSDAFHHLTSWKLGWVPQRVEYFEQLPPFGFWFKQPTSSYSKENPVETKCWHALNTYQ